ncbi:carboxy terminal-processing peptidase [uncultured Flavobacterium sp.]|uniref:carboxy terminal-processing peptidase n=1 Tax=uncultured Flavobacterium sp. TaxID=165435 RepID=UPI0030EE2573|tara:strand:+ start:297685 stop:299817 length:2133 start_codon:yes stop_codon:yes gene_type:complete
MKKNYKIILIITALSAVLFWSFRPKKVEANPEKDKLLLELLAYVLEKGHYSPIALDDKFSEKVYDKYLNSLDPFRRYFVQSDIEEFKVYEDSIDDFIKNKDLKFFDLTHSRLLQRMNESEAIYKDVLDKPFNFNLDETISVDYEKIPFAKNKKDLYQIWEKQLKFSVLSSIDDKEKIQEKADTNNKVEIKTFTELEKDARESIKKNLDDTYFSIKDLNRDDWFGVYLNSIVERFDPHTFYFSPENKERFDVSMSGTFEGIGARLQKKNVGVEVSELISGGPAWKGKELEQGDIIIKVAQGKGEPIDITGMRIDDVVKKIKGPKGTEVRLTVKRVDGSVKVISIIRDVVETEETFAKSSTVVKDGKLFGIIYLSKFYISFDNKDKRDAFKDVAIEIERLKKQKVQGIIMDLRDNGGGSLQTVVDMVGLFIDKGPVVQVKYAKSEPNILDDKDSSVQWDGPLVVMVNGYSASASEIFAAAIQDYKRGVVIGSKHTYGKGTVQNVIDLNDMVRGNSLGDLGSLKTTIQKFYRINGGSTQREGVLSDIVLPDRFAYFDTGERDEPEALPWDKIAPATYNTTGANFDVVLANSKMRVEKNIEFNLIDSYAKWNFERKDDKEVSLNYITYKKELAELETKNKTYDGLKTYKNNLTFSSLPYEMEEFKKDTLLKDKRDRWHEELSKDPYVDESLNVIQDIAKLVKSSNYVSVNKSRK